MSDNAKQMLLDISRHPNRETGMKLQLPPDPSEKKALSLAYQELISLGYIKESGSAIGSKYFSITKAGIYVVENL